MRDWHGTAATMIERLIEQIARAQEQFRKYNGEADELAASYESDEEWLPEEEREHRRLLVRAKFAK